MKTTYSTCSLAQPKTQPNFPPTNPYTPLSTAVALMAPLTILMATPTNKARPTLSRTLPMPLTLMHTLMHNLALTITAIHTHNTRMHNTHTHNTHNTHSSSSTCKRSTCKHSTVRTQHSRETLGVMGFPMQRVCKGMAACLCLKSMEWRCVL